MRIEAVSLGADPPHEINAIVEVPVGGEPIKYEMDKEAGTLVVDRFLYTSMRYPGNYGFMPHTLSGDGDPLDVLIANQRAIVPGAGEPSALKSNCPFVPSPNVSTYWTVTGPRGSPLNSSLTGMLTWRLLSSV